MPEHPPITPETVISIAAEMIGTPITPADAAAATALLNALAADRQALGRMVVNAEEPATTYAAVEGQP